MSVTIKDIAKVAQVSRGTVDRVLNGRDGVSADTVERVRKIAQAMGYKPNSAAKALSTLKKRMVFGVILPSVDNPFFIDLIDGIHAAQKELADYGVRVILREVSGYDIDTQLHAVDELLAEDITALALLPLVDDRVAAKINEVVESGIPVVTINSDIENSKRNCYIGTDFTQSGRLAAGLMGLLREEGNVLILSGSSRLLSHHQRVLGFNEVVSRRFPKLHVADTLECNDNNFNAYDLVSGALSRHPEIDAVYITAGGIKGACQAISKFPDRKITVVCFDDVPHIRELIAQGKIHATICQQPFRQGYEVVNYFFKYFADTDLSGIKTILMENIIKIRESL